jgi:hypothetical protein
VQESCEASLLKAASVLNDVRREKSVQAIKVKTSLKKSLAPYVSCGLAKSIAAVLLVEPGTLTIDQYTASAPVPAGTVMAAALLRKPMYWEKESTTCPFSLLPGALVNTCEANVEYIVAKAVRNQDTGIAVKIFRAWPSDTFETWAWIPKCLLDVNITPEGVRQFAQPLLIGMSATSMLWSEPLLPSLLQPQVLVGIQGVAFVAVFRNSFFADKGVLICDIQEYLFKQPMHVLRKWFKESVFHVRMSVGVIVWVPMGFHALIISLSTPLSGTATCFLSVPFLNARLAEQEEFADLQALQNHAQYWCKLRQDATTSVTDLHLVRATAFRLWIETIVIRALPSATFGPAMQAMAAAELASRGEEAEESPTPPVAAVAGTMDACAAAVKAAVAEEEKEDTD